MQLSMDHGHTIVFLETGEYSAGAEHLIDSTGLARDFAEASEMLLKSALSDRWLDRTDQGQGRHLRKT